MTLHAVLKHSSAVKFYKLSMLVLMLLTYLNSHIMTKKENNIYYQANSKHFDELQQLVAEKKKYYAFLKHSKSYLLDWINEVLKDKLEHCYDYSISTRVYWVLNGLEDFPTCKHCNKKDGYIGKNIKLREGYHEYCCQDCARRAEDHCKKISNSLKATFSDDSSRLEIVGKRKQTSKERHGDENFNNRKKAKQTCAVNYGVEVPFQAREVKEKSQQTKLDRYGDAFYVNPEKAKETTLERYGVENISQLEEIKEQKRKKSKDKYGVNCIFQADEVKDMSKQTCLMKYGVDNVLKLPENHTKQTMYLVEKSYDTMCECALDYPLFSFEEYCQRKDHNELLAFKCRKCGNEFQAKQHNGHHKHCEICYPLNLDNGISQQEKDLYYFIKDDCQQKKAIHSCRSVLSPLELDVYIEDKRLAVEFDGLYWHSEGNKDKNYHLKKTEQCEAKGIQLVHVFENEWIYKNDIVRSRLKNLLGIYDKIVYARKCEVREVKPSDSMDFQEENHIQGAIGAKVHLGLFYEEQLISIMTFGKPRYTKKAEWELLRFCNKLGYHIPGAAGKLLRHFERTYKPESLISYADRRWSQGKLYKALGFKLDHISKPDYWYIVDDNLESRVKYQKHKLREIFGDFDETKTEVQIMLEHGYRRIFDCGNKVYLKTINA